MLKTKLLLGAAAVTLMLCGPALPQDPGAKSINTAGVNGAYHTLFCPPLPAAGEPYRHGD
jgi:hypothetical protein